MKVERFITAILVLLGFRGDMALSLLLLLLQNLLPVFLLLPELFLFLLSFSGQDLHLPLLRVQPPYVASKVALPVASVAKVERGRSKS